MLNLKNFLLILLIWIINILILNIVVSKPKLLWTFLLQENYFTQNLDAVVGSELAQAVGRSVSGATTQTSLYAWIVFPASLVLLACGLLIAIRTFESQLSRRYERANASAKDLTPWQALDQGLDPTLEDPAK